MPYWLYERSSESEPTYTQSVDAELPVFGYKKGWHRNGLVFATREEAEANAARGGCLGEAT
jgi:hypothetical protein